MVLPVPKINIERLILQSYLSTLAQLSGTLFSIFLATVTAYYVFLQDRSAELQEKTEQIKLEIRDDLVRLQSTWPWALSTLLPHEFKDAYRSKYPNKSQADFISQAAWDLIFNNRELTGSLSEIRDQDNFGGPSSGRVYFWILNECVADITVGSPDTRTKPEGVFPSSPQGPGFEQWRNDFRKMNKTVQVLSGSKNSFMEDFKQFIAKLPADYPKAVWEEQFEDAVKKFFKEVEAVRAKLNEIDKQELKAKPYSFSDRVHLPAILILTGIAIVLGIILPMCFLALTKDVTSTLGIALFFLTLISIGGAFFQFAWDVSRPLGFDEKAYISARWYSFLLKEMDRQKSDIADGGLVDIEFFVDARNSTDRQYFPDQVRQALDDYIDRVNSYNEKTRRFNDLFLQSIATNTIIGPLVTNYKSQKGGPTLYPYNSLQSEENWRSHKDRFLRLPDTDDILIETIMPRWRHTRFKIPSNAFSADPSRLSKALDAVRASVKDTEVAKQFLEANNALGTSARGLQEALARVPK